MRLYCIARCLNFEIIKLDIWFHLSIVLFVSAYLHFRAIVLCTSFFLILFPRFNSIGTNDVYKLNRGSSVRQVFDWRGLVVLYLCKSDEENKKKTVSDDETETTLSTATIQVHDNEHNLHLWKGTYNSLFCSVVVTAIFINWAKSKPAIFSHKVKPIKIQMQIWIAR